MQRRSAGETRLWSASSSSPPCLPTGSERSRRRPAPQRCEKIPSGGRGGAGQGRTSRRYGRRSGGSGALDGGPQGVVGRRARGEASLVA